MNSLNPFLKDNHNYLHSRYLERLVLQNLFLDALSDERMTLGPIDEEGIREMQERYAALDPSDKKIVEEEEDKLLSTLIYNFTAYMIMMEVLVLFYMFLLPRVLSYYIWN